MLAAIYVRKSKFTGKGESIQNQIDMCKSYASDHGYDVSEKFIYYDEGFSGGNIERPAFKRLLTDIDQSNFDVLICYRLDRISRSISDFSTTLELLNDHNIAFVSIKEQFDTSTPMGRAMMYIASIFAQLERETAAERIRDNMYQLARTGRWLGGTTPTGFSSEPIIYMDKDMKERKMFKLSPIQEEQELVKTLFAKYLEFRSLSMVETYCLQHHIKTKNDKDFNKRQIRTILTNPVYAVADRNLYDYFHSLECDIASHEQEFDGKHGVSVYNKTQKRKHKSYLIKEYSEWIVAIGKHKGTIPSKDWLKVQQLLEINKSKAPRSGDSNVAKLTGLVHCSKCGSLMRVKQGHLRQDGVRPYYYVCVLKDRSRAQRCDMNNLSGIAADDFVINKVLEVVYSEGGILESLDKANKVIQGEVKDRDKEITSLKRTIKDNETAIENLVKQLSTHEDSTASKYIVKQIETIDVENTMLHNKINELKILDLNTPLMHVDVLTSMIEEFKKATEEGDHNKTKLLLGTLLKNVTWDGNILSMDMFHFYKPLHSEGSLAKK